MAALAPYFAVGFALAFAILAWEHIDRHRAVSFGTRLGTVLMAVILVGVLSAFFGMAARLMWGL